MTLNITLHLYRPDGADPHAQALITRRIVSGYISDIRRETVLLGKNDTVFPARFVSSTGPVSYREASRKIRELLASKLAEGNSLRMVVIERMFDSQHCEEAGRTMSIDIGTYFHESARASVGLINFRPWLLLAAATLDDALQLYDLVVYGELMPVSDWCERATG